MQNGGEGKDQPSSSTPSVTSVNPSTVISTGKTSSNTSQNTVSSNKIDVTTTLVSPAKNNPNVPAKTTPSVTGKTTPLSSTKETKTNSPNLSSLKTPTPIVKPQIPSAEKLKPGSQVPMNQDKTGVKQVVQTSPSILQKTDPGSELKSAPVTPKQISLAKSESETKQLKVTPSNRPIHDWKSHLAQLQQKKDVPKVSPVGTTPLKRPAEKSYSRNSQEGQDKGKRQDESEPSSKKSRFDGPQSWNERPNRLSLDNKVEQPVKQNAKSNEESDQELEMQAERLRSLAGYKSVSTCNNSKLPDKPQLSSGRASGSFSGPGFNQARSPTDKQSEVVNSSLGPQVGPSTASNSKGFLTSNSPQGQFKGSSRMKEDCQQKNAEFDQGRQGNNLQNRYQGTAPNVGRTDRFQFDKDGPKPLLSREMLSGKFGNDRPQGQFGNDRPQGKFGNDRPQGQFGNDRPQGQFGNDRPQGQFGNDRPQGQFGKDRPKGKFGNDRPQGKFGNDRPQGQFGTDRPQGQFGTDRPQGQFGTDRPQGQFGTDRPQGQFGTDRPQGQFGTDRPQGQFGTDRPQGQFGTDRPQGQFGNGRPKGHLGNDRPQGQFGNVRPQGQFGNDRPQGQFGNDKPQGQFGKDRSQGQFSKDSPQGQFGKDRPQGQFGNDRPQGQFGKDSLQGQFSNDRPQGRFGDYGPKRGQLNSNLGSKGQFDENSHRGRYDNIGAKEKNTSGLFDRSEGPRPLFGDENRPKGQFTDRAPTGLLGNIPKGQYGNDTSLGQLSKPPTKRDEVNQSRQSWFERSDIPKGPNFEDKSGAQRRYENDHRSSPGGLGKYQNQKTTEVFRNSQDRSNHRNESMPTQSGRDSAYRKGFRDEARMTLTEQVEASLLDSERKSQYGPGTNRSFSNPNRNSSHIQSGYKSLSQSTSFENMRPSIGRPEQNSRAPGLPYQAQENENRMTSSQPSQYKASYSNARHQPGKDGSQQSQYNAGQHQASSYNAGTQQGRYNSGSQQGRYNSGSQQDRSYAGSQQGGFNTGSQQGGFNTGSQQGGFNAGSQQGGFNAGSQQGGFNAGSQQGGFNAGSQQGGFNAGSQQGGFNAGSQQGGFNAGSQQGGFNAGSQQRGFNAGSQQGGFNAGSQQGGFNAGSQQGGFNAGSQQGGFNAGSQQGGFNAGSKQGGFNAGSKQGGFNTGSQQGGFNTGSQQSGHNTDQRKESFNAGPPQSHATAANPADLLPQPNYLGNQTTNYPTQGRSQGMYNAPNSSYPSGQRQYSTQGIQSAAPYNLNVNDALNALEAVSYTLGMLKPAITALIAVARKKGPNTLEGMKLFVAPDHADLVSMCLATIKENSAKYPSNSQLQSAHTYIERLMKYCAAKVASGQVSITKENLNMDEIAKNTYGADSTSSMSYIRQYAASQGVSDLTELDYNEIFFKVSRIHKEMSGLRY